MKKFNLVAALILLATNAYSQSEGCISVLQPLSTGSTIDLENLPVNLDTIVLKVSDEVVPQTAYKEVRDTCDLQLVHISPISHREETLGWTILPRNYFSYDPQKNTITISDAIFKVQKKDRIFRLEFYP